MSNVDYHKQYAIPRGIRPDKGPSVLRGDGEFLSSYCGRIRSYLEFLANKSEVSFRWYTHTNPAGCWICDTFVAAYALLRELETLSQEDMVGGSSQTYAGLPGATSSELQSETKEMDERGTEGGVGSGDDTQGDK